MTARTSDKTPARKPKPADATTTGTPQGAAPDLSPAEPSRTGMDGCHRRLPFGRRTTARSCELQASADERRLEVIWEKILQQHAAEDDEYYLANLEGQCEASTNHDRRYARAALHPASASKRGYTFRLSRPDRNRGEPVEMAVRCARPESEDEIQRTVFAHFAARRASGAFAFHPANGGYRRAVEGAILRGLGVVPGVPDLIIVHEGRCFALELKSDAGRLSEAQKLRTLRCVGQGPR
jgi:hypothetical protein